MKASLDAVVHESHETRSDNNVRNIILHANQPFIANPHGARRDPTTFASLFLLLRRAQELGNDLGQDLVGARFEEIVRSRDILSGLLDSPLPLIGLSPIFKLVAFA